MSADAHVAGSTTGRLADGLQSAAGVTRLFGMPGGGPNLDVIGAAAARGIPFTLAHGETAARVMAGAFGLLTGTPGGRRGDAWARPDQRTQRAGPGHPRPGAAGAGQRPGAGGPNAAGSAISGWISLPLSAPVTRWSGVLGHADPAGTMAAAVALALGPPPARCTSTTTRAYPATGRRVPPTPLPRTRGAGPGGGAGPRSPAAGGAARGRCGRACRGPAPGVGWFGDPGADHVPGRGHRGRSVSRVRRAVHQLRCGTPAARRRGPDRRGRAGRDRADAGPVAVVGADRTAHRGGGRFGYFDGALVVGRAHQPTCSPRYWRRRSPAGRPRRRRHLTGLLAALGAGPASVAGSAGRRSARSRSPRRSGACRTHSHGGRRGALPGRDAVLGARPGRIGC